MELVAMTVTNELGQCIDYCRFYAAVEPATTEKTAKIYEVVMITPQGGHESGVYRMPRIGNKVLVGVATSIVF